MPDITEKLYTEFTDRYLQDISIPGRGAMSTKMYIMQKTDWSPAQAHICVMKIVNDLRRYGRI